jgi:hypothetical protein
MPRRCLDKRSTCIGDQRVTMVCSQINNEPSDMVAHTCNLSTWEAEAGGLRAWGQPGPQSMAQSLISEGLKAPLSGSNPSR